MLCDVSGVDVMVSSDLDSVSEIFQEGLFEMEGERFDFVVGSHAAICCRCLVSCCAHKASFHRVLLRRCNDTILHLLHCRRKGLVSV